MTMRPGLLFSIVAILGLAFLLQQGFDWLLGGFFEAISYRIASQGAVWFMYVFMFLTFLMALMAPISEFIGSLLRDERAGSLLLRVALVGGLCFLAVTLI